MAKADPRAKFVELAEKRVTKALNDIRLIGNLSNRSNYCYTDEDAAKIHRALKKAIDEMYGKFKSKGQEEGVSFKL